MKTAVILTRIASIGILIHLAGHLLGHLSWKTPIATNQQEVVREMLTEKAPFMGVERSLGEFYDGYSLLLFVFFGISIAILWMLSVRMKTDKTNGYLLWPIGLGYITIGAIEAVRFFPFAAVISLLSGILLVLAALIVIRTQRHT